MFLFLTTAQSVLLYSSLHLIPLFFSFLLSPLPVISTLSLRDPQTLTLFSYFCVTDIFTHNTLELVDCALNFVFAMFACCPAVICFSISSLSTTSQLFSLFILYNGWTDEWIKSFFLKTNASFVVPFIVLLFSLLLCPPRTLCTSYSPCQLFPTSVGLNVLIFVFFD